MKIQSLSIVVPTRKCVNNCAFCVSKTHDNDYENKLKDNDEFYEQEYIERLEFARDNGVNTIILTGTGEALQNKRFLRQFAKWNKNLSKPFHIIELQTSGVFLDNDTLDWLRKEIRVKTISLSVSDLFDNDNNNKIIGVPNKLKFDLDDVAKRIKEKGFNLRISLNVLKNIATHEFALNHYNWIFNRLKELGTDQITFRKLWKSGNNTEIDQWIENNEAPDTFFDGLNDYIKSKGRLLGRLTFGALQYEIGGENGISTVIDQDCMADKEVKEEFKYLILRENCKIYFNWWSKSSLIF